MRNYMVEWRSGLKEQRQASSRMVREGPRSIPNTLNKTLWSGLRPRCARPWPRFKVLTRIPEPCQKNIKKSSKHFQKNENPQKVIPGSQQKQGPKQNTNTSRLLSSPWCQNVPCWRPFYQKSPLGAPKAPKRVQKDAKKRPTSTPKGIPKRVLNQTPKMRPLFSPNVSKNLIFPKCL